MSRNDLMHATTAAPLAPMSDDQIRRVAPSVFAETKYGAMSDKYAYISTSQVVTALRKEGFQPVRALQSRSRIEGKEFFTRHMVVFRTPDDSMPLARVGDIRPEIILINSHDGTSSYQLHAGLFRMVCTNGLVIADSMLASIKILHFGRIVDSVIEGSFSIAQALPDVLGKVDAWRSLALPERAQTAYAEAALTLRYGDGHRPVEASDILTPKRREDQGNDLWSVYNRVQEHVMRGGVAGRRSDNRRTTTRSVSAVNQTMRLNKGLWTINQEMDRIVNRGDDPQMIDVSPIVRELADAARGDEETRNRLSEIARRAVATRRERLLAAVRASEPIDV